MQDSSMFRLIFKFSIKKSVRSVLFAYIPPTLAAALITTSGPNSEIYLEVSSRLNRFVSFLVEKYVELNKLLFSNNLFKELPTNPLLPKTNNFIFF